MKKYAFSYSRFSSSAQAKGSSLYRQQKRINTYLAQNPHVELVDNLTFTDDGISGYSGKHIKKGDMASLLQAITDGLIRKDYICLVESVDRIGRLHSLDMLDLFRRIVQAGITIITLEDGVEYTANSIQRDPGQLIVLVTKIQSANGYSEQLSERMITSYDKRRSQARKGRSIKIRTPFWLDAENKVKPEEGKQIKQMFELYLQGLGSDRIQRKIGIDVGNSSINRWLSNKTAIGYWQTIPGVFEPVVSEETFYAAQKILRKGREKPIAAITKRWTTGLVKCAMCGTNLTVKPSNMQTHVLRCPLGKKKGVRCSNTKQYPLPFIEEIIRHTHLDALDRYRQQIKNRELDRGNVVLEEKLAEVEFKITNLVTILASVQSDEVINQLQSFEQEKSTLQRNLQEAKATSGEYTYDVDIFDFADSLKGDLMELNTVLQGVEFKLIADSVGNVTDGEVICKYIGYDRKYKCAKYEIGGDLVRVGHDVEPFAMPESMYHET